MLNEIGWYIMGGLLIVFALIWAMGKARYGTALALGLTGFTFMYAGPVFDTMVIQPGWAVIDAGATGLYNYLCLGLIITTIAGIFLVLANYLKYNQVIDTYNKQGFYSMNARWRMVLAFCVIITFALPAVASHYYTDYTLDNEASSVIYDLDLDPGATAMYSWEHPSYPSRQVSDLLPITDGETLTATINDGTYTQPYETDYVNHTSEFVALFVYDTEISNKDLVNLGLGHANITIDFTEIAGNLSEGLAWTMCLYYSGGDPGDFYEFTSGTYDNYSATLSINYAFTFEDLQAIRGNLGQYIGVIIEPTDADNYFDEGDIFEYDIKFRKSTLDLAKSQLYFNISLLAIMVFDIMIYGICTDYIEIPSEGETRTRTRGKNRKSRKRRR